VFAAIVARSIDGAPTRSISRPTVPLHNPSRDERPVERGGRDHRWRLQPEAAAVRPILSPAAGVMREGERLRAAVAPLAALARSAGPAADPAAVALAIVIAALRSEYTAGAHCRLDFPRGPAEPCRLLLTLGEALAEASAIAPDPLAKRA